MFLLSLLSAALIGNGEKVKGNYKAYKYNKKADFTQNIRALSLRIKSNWRK